MSNGKSNNKNKARISIRDRGRPAFYRCFYSDNEPRQRRGLYSFVYSTNTSFLVALLLVTSFFLQGAFLVHANEANSELVVVDMAPAASDPATSPEIPLETETNVEIAADTIVLLDEIAVTSTPPKEVLPLDSSEIIAETADLESDDVYSLSMNEFTGLEEFSISDDMSRVVSDSAGEESMSDVSSGTSSSLVSETDLSIDSEPEVGLDDEPPALASSTEDVVIQVTDLIIGTGDDETSFDETDDFLDDEFEPIGPALTEPVSTSYSDSGYMFTKNECTELASGSFYCIEPKENVLADALFAAPDADGDLEIFLVRDGVQTQVTENLADDAAPYYDQNSNTIVWHRLMADRYQIVSYDIATQEEVLLTENATNDMEPTRQGKYTVWQRWVGNNWDIILHDGNDEVQISHATAHDIAPYIHGTLVVWNRYTMSGVKTIEMYDIDTESYVTVDDPAGLSVSNPRMVLVYDQLHPNGDVVTKGYDMIARQFIALDTLPRELPGQLPKSEPTPETRALIQAKPSVKGEDISATSTDGGDVPPPLPETSDTPGTYDLDLTATSSVLVPAERAPITEFDLIVEAYSGENTERIGVQASSTP